MADQLLTGTTLVENTSRSQGDVPIGGVIPWLKSLTGVYSIGEGWVECNGQTLVDPQSSINGQVIPDLNGFTGTQRFLRGGGSANGTTATASGTTGGSETHAHTNGSLKLNNDNGTGWNTASLSTPLVEIISGAATGALVTSLTGGSLNAEGVMTSSVTGTTGATSTLPSYYSVVWIMRVR